MMETANDTPAPEGLINRLCDGLANACLIVGALSLLCIVAINGANVVARYFFGSPFSWAEELMLFLMILGVFAGAVAITWRNLHIRIDAVVDRMPRQMRRVTMTLASIASIAIIATVMVASFRLVALLQSMDQRSDALQAPSWIPQSFVTIGLGLMALMMAVRLVTSLRR